jgi:hypothetical protein
MKKKRFKKIPNKATLKALKEIDSKDTEKWDSVDSFFKSTSKK